MWKFNTGVDIIYSVVDYWQTEGFNAQDADGKPLAYYLEKPLAYWKDAQKPETMLLAIHPQRYKDIRGYGSQYFDEATQDEIIMQGLYGYIKDSTDELAVTVATILPKNILAIVTKEVKTEWCCICRTDKTKCVPTYGHRWVCPQCA